ncbi:hypothetical protein NQZ68_008364, partial [Dissostichus eleginoides]
MSDNKKINHLLERASPVRVSLEEVELQQSIKRTLSLQGALRSVPAAHVARDWERDTSPSRPCNKRVLRPGHHSKGA